MSSGWKTRLERPRDGQARRWLPRIDLSCNLELILMKTRFCTSLAALLLSTVSLGVFAAEPRPDTRLYFGASMGGSSFSLESSGRTASFDRKDGDKKGTAYKLYGGYRLTENFGIEGGYARLGRVSQWTSARGASVLQSASGQAFYGAATARIPLGESFALNGRLGLARGKVSGNDMGLPSARSLSGNATGVMAGFGAEYSVARNVSLTADFDYFGKLSKQVKGGMLTVGLRANF